MASPHTVIANAFEKLNQAISEEDAQNFASTELKEVWLAVRDIDSKQRKRQSAQNLRRIEPLLEGIGKYTKVIEVLCNGTPFMPYVWAPIKLMLEIASHYRDIFEALLSAYADIGAALPRFDRYQTAFNDNLEFQHALAATYAGILDFHQRAYKYFRRRAWHIFFLSLWKDFGVRFDSIIVSLKKQRDFIDVEAASFDIVEAKESRMRLQDEIRRSQKREQEIVEENEKNARTSQLRDSITWLSADEKIQETAYERTSRRRHGKTCQWILNEPRWKNWMKDDSKSPCLWFNGKPGSGKSVMCSYIVQALTDTPSLTTCYYFCNSQDAGNICHQILIIVVLQILRQHPEICTLIANEYVYRGNTCGMVQLRSLVPQLLEIIGYARIVIDGIDECPKENQKLILKELQAICIGPKTNCKVLFSSRREVYIREKLSDLPQISLDGRQEVDWDIRSFVKYKISKLRTSDQDLLSRIESILVKKADGMFLWVRLVVDELKYCYSDASMEATATNLPKGLKAAYGRILDRIIDPNSSSNARYMAIRILRWMACSYRTLKIYELLDGIAFDSSDTILTLKTKIRKDILDLCRPLIEDGPSNTIDFVHFSAKEYILEEEYQAGRPFIWRENAHLDIAFSCAAVLNSCFSLLPTNSTDTERAAIIVQGFHGLQIYADKFWYKHVLEYCRVLVQKRHHQVSPELMAQLYQLLRFKKSDEQAISESKNRIEDDGTEESGLEAFNHVTNVKTFILDILKFRAKMSRGDTSDKSPERISLDLCGTDPTHFSTIRYHYHKTTQALLDDGAFETFRHINSKDLEMFQKTYKSSAFVCRYLHCVFSTDGFESCFQRDKHESQHQRRFRCAHSSCFYYSTGFISRTLLNKHNERYHPTIVEGPSFAESLASAQFTSWPRIAAWSPARFDLPNLLEQSVVGARGVSPGSSSSGLSTPPPSSPEPADTFAQFANNTHAALQNSVEKPPRKKPGRKPEFATNTDAPKVKRPRKSRDPNAPPIQRRRKNASLEASNPAEIQPAVAGPPRQPPYAEANPNFHVPSPVAAAPTSQKGKNEDIQNQTQRPIQSFFTNPSPQPPPQPIQQQQQQPAIRTSGQNYNPIQSNYSPVREIVISHNSYSNSQGSPSHPHSMNRASASPSISSLVDPPNQALASPSIAAQSFFNQQQQARLNRDEGHTSVPPSPIANRLAPVVVLENGNSKQPTPAPMQRKTSDHIASARQSLRRV